MLAEDVVVLDADARLWRPMQPLWDAALQLSRGNENARWHSWSKQEIIRFLRELPAHCSLFVGVWDMLPDGNGEERELLVAGCVCEVVAGEIRTIRTIEALYETRHPTVTEHAGLAGLPPVEQLEPGYEHALALLGVARKQIAPVAWALFTDKATWDEWLFGGTESGEDAVASKGEVIDKGEQLAKLALQGRCVLMGSQTSAHHHV